MLKIIILLALLAAATSEPPVGGGYGGGHSSNEGQIPGPVVDQDLLDRITAILNQQENQQGGYSSGPSSSYGAPPASSYGPPPSSAYGAPHRGNIQLGKVNQGILVANFVEHETHAQAGPGPGYGAPQHSGDYGRR